MDVKPVVTALLCAAVAVAVPSSAQAFEEIGSAVGTTPSANGSVTGALALGGSVVKDEVVRTGPNGTLEIQFKDGTHLGVARSSSVALDDFVYSVSNVGDKVVLKLTRGAFRFATGSLPKSAYRIETPVASIGVRGTILSIVTDKTGLKVSVDEGAASVCARGGSRGCANIDSSNRTVSVARDGRISRPRGIVTVALGCAQSSGGSVFCLAAHEQNSVREKAIKAALTPALKTADPASRPSKAPEATGTTRPSKTAEATGSTKGNPGNSKSVGKAGETPGGGGGWAGGSHGKGDNHSSRGKNK